MATAYQILSAVAAAALLVSCASACGSVPSYNAGSFTDMVPWGCMEPFDCFVEFCTCVDGQMTSTCTPFGAVNATTVERCAARRVTCTLNAALRSHNVWNQSCRGWGENLASLYATYYSDRTFTNLTDACMSDMCALVSAGNSALVEQVNFEHICSFVGFEFPAPLDRDEVAGCAAPARTYFDEIPVTQCNGTTSCYETYCSCVGGAWSASGPQCMMPAAQPPQSLLDSCLSAAVGCLTGAALDIYTPGATALNADPCLEWAVPIAEDFHAYRNASDKSMTALWQACNYTSCKELYRFNSSASFSSVCSFAAVTNRTSNFIPYDPCPFKCPDATCAGNLAGCACTATATIGEISAIFTRQVSANLDMTRTLGGSAFTTYGVANGMNCSDFNFNPLLRFSWTLSNASGVQYTTASSTFSIPSMFMWPGTYSLNVTVTGLVPSQRRARSWQLTVVAPTPVVSITGNGATLRISNQRAISIPAKVTDTFLSVNDFAWSCVAIEGTCPSIENSTATVLFIASNASVGTYVITYTYKSQYTSSVTLTVINGAIPFVRIILPSGALATSPVAAFTYQQSVTLASVVDYSSPFDYNWTINDGALISNRSTVTVAANTLVVTTLADANNGNFQYNTFRIRVYSRENRNIFGEATKTVVVLEDITASLTIAREGSAELVAQGLTDKLVFTYATAPSLTLGTAPFGASLDASIVYFASETATAGLFLATKPSSASLVGTAPLFTDRNVSFKTIRFGVEIRLNGVLTATASATFNITKGDIGAAAASARAALTQIADKGAAVAALSDVNAIIAQTDNATLAAELRTAAFNMIVSNIGNTTVLSASESKAVLSSVAAMLSSTSSSSGGSGSTSEKARTSAKLVGLFTAVLTSDSFDLTVASSVGSAISQMDSTSGGSVAMLTVLKMSSKVSPGEVLSLDLGDIGSVTSTAQTGSALSNLVVADPSGAEVKLPSTFLADLGVDPTAVFGVATAVLKKSPFATGGDPSGGVVSQDITANGESISVSGLSSPIEITLPGGSVGTCQFFQVSTQLWTDDGVVTELTAAGMVCKTSHLTSFGGFDSSAASVALSVLVLVLVALTQVMLA